MNRFPFDEEPPGSEEGGGFSERFRSHKQEQAEAVKEPIGEFCAEEILIGGLMVDSAQAKSAGEIKHFLTKSSSLLTASETIGDLVPDLHFDAVDEKREQQDALRDGMNEWQLQTLSARNMRKQAVISRMLQRLAAANVARKADQLDHHQEHK